MGLAFGLYEDLIDAPAPLPEAAHSADPLPINLGCKQRTEPVPPEPHRLVTDVDTALSKQVLDNPQDQ
jgi:hypothetical protein